MSVFDIPLAELRQRRSAKWSRYPSTLLPGWVAEMDVRLAPPIAQALHQAVSRSDTGYAGDPTGAIAAFADFADQEWGWPVDVNRTVVCADLAAAVTAVLRRVGGPVIINPPVYNLFFHWVPGADQQTVEVGLGEGRLDLAAMEAALRAGARTILLCNPQNPVGLVHTREELRELAQLAERYEATVISDEIHAPLVYSDVEFVPFLTVSAAARRCGIALQSASKAWNVAGLKCAFITTAPGGPELGIGDEMSWGAGLFGIIVAEVAYTQCRDWLHQVRDELASRAQLLGRLLATSLPTVGYQQPQFGYLAWLDCRELNLPGSAGQTFADRGSIILSPGEIFDPAAPGWVRLNFGTSPELVTELVAGMARSVGSS